MAKKLTPEQVTALGIEAYEKTGIRPAVGQMYSVFTDEYSDAKPCGCVLAVIGVYKNPKGYKNACDQPIGDKKDTDEAPYVFLRRMMGLNHAEVNSIWRGFDSPQTPDDRWEAISNYDGSKEKVDLAYIEAGRKVAKATWFKESVHDR